MLLSEPTLCLPQKHCESEYIALFLFILKTMIVLYIERALGGMRWICLVEEGESDQYRSACSCCRSLNDAEVVMQVLGFTSLWVTVTAHRFLWRFWVHFEDGSLYERHSGESVEQEAEARPCADVLDIQELSNGWVIILPHKWLYFPWHSYKDIKDNQWHKSTA